jgi:hypothetical protein
LASCSTESSTSDARTGTGAARGLEDAIGTGETEAAVAAVDCVTEGGAAVVFQRTNPPIASKPATAAKTGHREVEGLSDWSVRCAAAKSVGALAASPVDSRGSAAIVGPS